MENNDTITKVRNKAEKDVRKAVSHREEDIKIFKQKVKSGEIELHTKNKEIKYLKNKIARLEKILKVHK